MSDWKRVIKDVAPVLATVLGGPLSGGAIAYLSDRLFGNPDEPESKIEDFVLSATPDKLVEIKRIDAEYKTALQNANVDITKLGVEDRKSARKMAEMTSIIPQIVLSILFIGGYFFIVYALFSGTIQLAQGERDLANVLLGVLTAGVPMILRFWFGGSLNDDKQLDKIYHSIPKR